MGILSLFKMISTPIENWFIRINEIWHFPESSYFAGGIEPRAIFPKLKSLCQYLDQKEVIRRPQK